MPDGHTLFFSTTGNLAVNPSLYPKLPFNILRDFMAVSHVALTSSLIYVQCWLRPITRRIDELIKAALSRPIA